MKRRIALLTHFFPPEPCAAANRAASLAHALSISGNDVTVVTNFPSFPAGRVDARDAGRLIRTQELDGVRVVRLHTRVFRGWPMARLWQWIYSGVAASMYLIAGRQAFDDVIVTVPPITLALPALCAAQKFRAKLVVDVRDVYPDIAIAMGEWKANGLLARATEFVARLLYRRADLVTAVTPTALAQIAGRGVPEARLLLARNGIDVPDALELEEAQKSRESFVGVYAGNLGLATDVDTILDAARLLRSRSRIVIQIVGDGAEGERVRRRVAQENLSNVELRGSVSRVESLRILAGADIAIVPLRRGIRESVPTKIFDALSVGCPVLACADGEARTAVYASGGGIAVEPGDPQALADALLNVAELTPDERARIGARGKAFVEQHFRRDVIMTEYTRRIARLQAAT